MSGATVKDGGPQMFRPEDVPDSERCVAGPPFHQGPCRNADGEPIDDVVRALAARPEAAGEGGVSVPRRPASAGQAAEAAERRPTLTRSRVDPRTRPLEPVAASGASQTLILEDFPHPADARALSPNGRAHWTTRSVARKEVASVVVIEATRSRLRVMWGPVRLLFRYVFPTRSKHDLDNLTTGVTKAAIDALVRGGWITADDSRYVVEVKAEAVYEQGRRALEIVIEEA